MKEAFLMGILAMSNQADDADINLIEVVTPVTVTQNGETIQINQNSFHYGVTANDTKSAEGPHVTRFINTPS